MQQSQKGFVFTGYHMLAILVAFFGVIISVNLLMAYYANSSWSGLISPNTYVASQEFNIKADAARKWIEAGIKGKLDVSESEIRYSVAKPDGPLAVDQVKARFRHPVGEKNDFSLDLTPMPDGTFAGHHDVSEGEWIIELLSIKGTETVFHEAVRIHISGGKI